jgi:hypothetical protein
LKTLVGRVVFLGFICLALAAPAEAMVYWESNRGVERTNLDRSYRSDVPDFSRFTIGGFIQGTRADCGIAVNSTHIYWVDRGGTTIARANLDGTEADFAFIEGVTGPCGITLDESYVYWANGGSDSIGRAKLDGSEVSQAFVSAVGDQPCGVAVDDEFVYWASAMAGQIGRASRMGGGSGSILIETPEIAPCGVAVDGTHLYWGGFSHSIGRADIDGSNVEHDFIDGLDQPCALAIEGSHIYWSEHSTRGMVGRAGLDGNGVDQTFIDSSSSCSVAVDSLHYIPPPPPQSSFKVGKPRRSTTKGMIFIPIDFPDAGHFTVKIGPGFEWRLVNVGFGPAIFGGGRKWLRVRAAPKGRQGHNVRRALRNRGKIQFKIEMHYAEVSKNTATKEKTLSLIRKERPPKRERLR